MRHPTVFVLFIVILFSPTLSSTTKPELSGKITVLQAASLTEFFRKAKVAFEQKHPKVTVLLEPGASLVLIRKIADLNTPADVITVADRTLIRSYLIPEHVDQSIDFLTEQIALIATDNAKYADTITKENWPEILLKQDVQYGISNPETAPVGYRTLMVWKLAEKHYQKPGLYQKLREKLPRQNIRQNATALLTLLKTGDLDYVFNYASLARQNGLRTIPLPPQMNLGDPAFADLYGTVSVEIPGHQPGTQKTLMGATIVYSIALLKNSNHPRVAQAFIDFILGENGRPLMAEMGMTPLVSR